MARRRITTVLLVAAVVGGAGGYGAGELTKPDRSGASDSRSPIAKVSDSQPVQVKTPEPDRTKALRAADLTYQSKKFDAEQAVRSRVTVRVPRGWGFTQPQDDQGRYTSSEGKRWIRIEAGFEPTFSPAASMQRRIRELEHIDPTQGLQILNAKSGTTHQVDGTPVTYSTLTYSYIPDKGLRYVMVRWISVGEDTKASVEMSVCGLPQDSDALLAVLQRATQTVDRSDSGG